MKIERLNTIATDLATKILQWTVVCGHGNQPTIASKKKVIILQKWDKSFNKYQRAEKLNVMKKIQNKKL